MRKNYYYLLAAVLCTIISFSFFRPEFRAVTPQIHHVVLCWLAPDQDKDTLRESILAESETLKSIEEIAQFQAGVALPSDRAIVDDSFDLGFVMTFASKMAMEAYLSDPIHREFVKTHITPYVQKILVYDVSVP